MLSKLAGIFLIPFLFLATPVFAEPIFVEAEWLAKNLGKKEIVLIDMSSEDTQYDRFHIPGAHYFRYHYTLDVSKKSKFPKPVTDQRLAKILGQFGVSSESYIVLYDDMGGLNAGRLFWHLERMGHKKVSVLNGGLVNWILSGRKVTSQVTAPKAVQYVLNKQASKAGKRKNHVFLADIKAASKDASTVVLDVRSDIEYLGDIKKRKGGHVPGAKWWPWQQAVDFQKGFSKASKRKIGLSLQKAGITNSQQLVIVYCRSGHRASQTYLTMRSLGYENVKLYANSMNEYGRSGSKLRQGKNP